MEKIELGKTYNSLTALVFDDPDQHGRIHVVCRCVCGKLRRVRQDRLLSGETRSCGCVRGPRKGSTTRPAAVLAEETEKTGFWGWWLSNYRVGEEINA